MKLPPLSLCFAMMLLTCFSGNVLADDAVAYSFTYQGVSRRYLLVAPDSSADSAPMAVVLVLHGGGGNPEQVMRSTGFGQLALAQGFIAVFPEGTGRTRFKTWNAGHCCGYAMHNAIDDVGFMDALLDRLLVDPRVDGSRIFVTGMSNGGMMTQRIGIHLAHRITAIAPVMSGLFGDEAQPQSPVSALIINGARDESIPVQGGQSNGPFSRSWDGAPLMPASYQSEFWAAADDCTPYPTKTDLGQGLLITHYTCPQGRQVVHYLLEDSGHAWPGGEPGRRRADQPSNRINATASIWDFFQSIPDK